MNRVWFGLAMAMAMLGFTLGYGFRFGPTGSFSPSEAVADRSAEYEDWVLMYPRGLTITQDADRVAEIREAMSAIECPASPGERADAYIRARYVLPNADWKLVYEIAASACRSYRVVEDVPSFAEEMAYISLLMPDYSVTQLSNTAFVFRSESSGKRFLWPEWGFVTNAAMKTSKPDAEINAIGYLAAVYASRGSIESAQAIIDALEE